MRKLFPIVFIAFILLLGLAFCRETRAPQGTAQLATMPAQTPFATTAPVALATATVPPAAPVAQVDLPVENSEWYIDGWAEDAIVVNMYGREMRFDLAEFRHTQTNAPIVVQCIDSQAARPNLDFALPLEQRDRFVYKGNQFWHVADPAVQRFIFVRHGELQ